jgi:hypothetical protein
MNPPAAMTEHTATASAQIETPLVLVDLNLREGCCGQFMQTAETHPPARTLLVVRTGASTFELSSTRDSRHCSKAYPSHRNSARQQLRVQAY